MREQVVYHECNVAYSSKPCHSHLEGQGRARRHSVVPCKVIVARLSVVGRFQLSVNLNQACLVGHVQEIPIQIKFAIWSPIRLQ